MIKRTVVVCPGSSVSHMTEGATIRRACRRAISAAARPWPPPQRLRALLAPAALCTGYTYNLFTDCATTHGSPILRLLDLDGTEVAYNE